MTTDRKYNDPALREALRLEQAAMPHFQLTDGWQDAVMKRTKSTSRRLIWTVAAAIVVLLIGAAGVLWKQKAGYRGKEIEVGYQEARSPKVETPVVIAQTVPAQVESSTEITRSTRKNSSRRLRQPKQEPNETSEPPAPTSLSANRDRMRQAMFEKMNRYSDMTDFESEILDEI
ncbi:MAG: hypothetical protein IK075_01390 [Prevotella sp.]|nr:hypothetical protein [Prevotella sp.]